MIEYIPILVFIVFALIFSVGAFSLSILVGKKAYYRKKCPHMSVDFEPFDESRGKFEVKFLSCSNSIYNI